MVEEKRVSYAKDRLKGSTLVWGKMMQDDRVTENKKKITSWERMNIRLKVQFLPTDYEIQMYKKVQNLKQKYMIVSAYTKEFNKLSLRVRR